MPLQATSGAASYDAFGGGVPVVPNYIEDVFSCFLYTGTGSSQTITNNIDLSTKGGLTWIKGRSGATGHRLTDTARGVTKSLASETTAAEATETTGLTAFGTTGFTIGADADYNTSAATYASWTFRKQPKFFDVVTYSGNGSAGGQTINHNLGATVGCIIVKRTDAIEQWRVYHTTQGVAAYAGLNSTAAFTTDANNPWKTPTSTTFGVGDGTYWTSLNASGGSYVAYLFAHNAGGFGLTGTDNVITCGSFTTDGSGNATVNLGYEPQWILIKSSSSAGLDWYTIDNMRGWSMTGGKALSPNSSTEEFAFGDSTYLWQPTSTGFLAANGMLPASSTFIYIAIRRGPMKVPTSGTSVFGINARTGTGANATVTGGAGVSDAVLVKNRGSTPVWLWASRLTGTGYLSSNATTAEIAAGTTILQANPWDVMDGAKVGTTSTITNASSNTFINYLFKRAPGFFDEVCYTGTGAAMTVSHNLGAVPELIILKPRSAAQGWMVYVAPLGNNKYLTLNSTFEADDAGLRWNDTTPTSSVFSVGKFSGTTPYSSASGATYVAYLFATCAGVSKVGSYTGTGTTLQIDCGFTAGARFVLIKRYDSGSTGDWYVWDSARGIVSGNDPYLLLNSTDAEVTGTDYVDTYSAGFEISSTAPAAINASGGSFIFLAIA
jgi:hypothetical protein